MKTTMNHSSSQIGGNRDGIALIIVLGLLAVLVVFGVAFSISMRTERIATRSYLDVVKARQLTHTALTRTLGLHINDEMMPGIVYPDEEVYSIPDASTNQVRLLGDRTMTSGAVFIPMSLRSSVFNGNHDYVQWIAARDPQDNTFHGEYAFLVVNCSGLLDANVIGARENESTPRQRGFDPGEIRFHPNILPEVYPSGQGNFASYRGEFRKFESVPELYYLLSSSDFDSQIGTRPLKQIGSSPTAGSMADNLHVFSRFPKGYANDNLTANTNVVFIGGDPKDWDMPALRNAIADIDGAPAPDPDAFAAVIYDYADEGYIPYGNNNQEKLHRISSKPVPMINEVIVRTTFELSGDEELTHRVHIEMEVWYPFPNDPDSPSFTVRYDGVPSIRVVTRPPDTYSSLQFGQAYERHNTPETVQLSVDKPYAVITNTFFKRQVVNCDGCPKYPPADPRVGVQVRMEHNMEVRYLGDPVDQVLGNWPNVNLQGNAPATPSPGAPVNFMSPNVSAFSVNDPRINWDPSNGQQWSSTAGQSTPGAFNSGYAVGQFNDEIGFMYSRRGPIRSVGEIGFLLFDKSKPWQTVRLIEPAVPAITRVIDRIGVHTTFPRRGLVNPNTRQPDVLAAAIWTLPLEKYPDASGGTTLTDTQAKNIAAHWVTRNIAMGGMTNISSLSSRLQQGPIDTELATATDKFTRESLLRNTYGILSTRHNLFTIFVAARVFSPTYNPSTHFGERASFVTAEQRAVAVVWRDPFETTDGAGNSTYQSWVQYFHWFSGAFGD